MKIAKIDWKEVTFDKSGVSVYGYLNDSLLFEIRVTGKKVVTYKLLSYPIKNSIFVSGNNSKVLNVIKTGYNNVLSDIKIAAENHLSDYINMFMYKPKLFKVIVTDKSTAHPDQIIDGYLAAFGVVQTYELNDAKKKAKMFNGILEPVN